MLTARTGPARPDFALRNTLDAVWGRNPHRQAGRILWKS